MARDVAGVFPLSRRLSVHPQTAAGLAVLAGLAALILGSSRIDPAFGIFGVLGVGFGLVLQRSRFCFNSAFRDLLQFRSGRTMKGVIVGLAVATAGFGMHMYNLLPNPFLGPAAPEAHAVPLSAALIIGGVLFGVGMVSAGGCTSGSMYRMGEGYVASWVAFAGILIGLLFAAHTWNWWWEHLISPAPVIWFPRYLGYGGAIAITLALLAAGYVLVLWIESRGRMSDAPSPSMETPAGFGDRLRSLGQAVFMRSWSPAIGGVFLALLNILAYQAHMPWRVVGELSRWSSAAAGVVGLGPGPLHGTEDLAACTLTVGGGLWTHALMLNVGLIAGSFMAALLAREFKLRVPKKPVRYVQSLGGGLSMGYGAGLALGCTVGAFFSAIPSLALNGWVFALSLAAGAALGVRLIHRLS